MNLAELRTEVQDLGFHDVGATRIETWINQANAEICDAERWPFMETSTSGTAPLTISDLAAVKYVHRTTGGVPLYHEPIEAIVNSGRVLSTTGTATRFYVTGGTVVNVWPVEASLNITVRYWKTTPTLTASTDTPLIPTRFHNLIVAGAVRQAYAHSGNPQQAETVETERQRGLGVMLRTLLRPESDRPLAVAE